MAGSPKSIVVASALLALVLGSIVGAQAQMPNSSTPGPKGAPQKQTPHLAHETLNTAPTTKLTSAVEIPNLPHYPGPFEFRSGTQQTAATDTVTTQTFAVSGTQAETIKWYTDNLGMYKWKVSNAGKSYVSALDPSNNQLVLNTQATLPKDTKFKSLVRINFVEHHK